MTRSIWRLSRVVTSCVAHVLQVMADQQIDAIAYPTIRRTARPIGEPQPGTNCILASVAGLPATKSLPPTLQPREATPLLSRLFRLVRHLAPQTLFLS